MEERTSLFCLTTEFLRYLMNGDPITASAKTSRLLAEKLGLSHDEYMTTFQSRFGREEWLKPYTDEMLKSLPEKVKSIQVMCPGFQPIVWKRLKKLVKRIASILWKLAVSAMNISRHWLKDKEHIDVLYIVQENLHGWTVQSDNGLCAGLARALGAEK